MFTHVSKLTKTIGLAAGLLLIGGSMVGGIALAADNGGGPAPAVTATTPVPDATGDHRGDDADDQDDDADDQGGPAGQSVDGRGGQDDCDEGETSDDDCTAPATATPAPTTSHHDDDGDDD
jgi:hypothetical protein